ncbi:S8 family peptidase [Sorangium sp. So ce385]|uniref:S8 family peptidase n=1 Tax=Sorangium sp. So ce385 TaxID=3133308 RepID=UPI003F5BC1C9
MKLWGISACALSMVLLGCVGEPSWEEETDPQQTAEALHECKGDLTSGPGAKLGPHLLALQRAAAAHPSADDAAFARKFPALRVHDGYVAVSAYGDDGAALAARLAREGMLDAKVHGESVSGRVPIARLGAIAAMRDLRYMKPTMAATQAGLVTTQGDRSLRSDVARARFGVDGRGVRVGVLSDSFDCRHEPLFPGQMFTDAADDIRNDDLPRDTVVLEDVDRTTLPGCLDEGRAMMQIIHDVAPGASLSFHTASISEDDFAAGIVELADNGARVIVDDIIYFDEPMFEDGRVADAVDRVVKRGVAYFSAAGNVERQSYQSRFRDSGRVGECGGQRHDFDPGPRVDDLQRVSASAESTTIVAFNWDQPSLSANGRRGSQSDLDLVFYHMNGERVEECTLDPAQVVCQIAGIADNLGRDAVEVAALVNGSGVAMEFQIGIELIAGPKPDLMKYVWIEREGTFSVEEFDTRSSTMYGHMNAAGAEAVGAAAWFQTEEWGPLNRACVPACLESFSSVGGTPILFDDRGRRLPIPEVRLKPGVTGPDGGNTTFFFAPITVEIPGSTEPDRFPNFFGTSASAPHVAAVAALMLDAHARDVAAGTSVLGSDRLPPALVYLVLRLTAEDMRLRDLGGEIGPVRVEGAPGFDFETGFGFVDAVRALRVISNL